MNQPVDQGDALEAMMIHRGRSDRRIGPGSSPGFPTGVDGLIHTLAGSASKEKSKRDLQSPQSAA